MEPITTATNDAITVTPAQLLTELRALAIPGVRDYTLLGVAPDGPSGHTDTCSGVYAWDDGAPPGEYRHRVLSAADADRIRSALEAHVPTPPPDPLAAIQQRKEDAALSLNNAAIRGSQAQRDAFARLIGCKPPAVPLLEDAAADDIEFL